MAYMDYIDPDVHCPWRDVKFTPHPAPEATGGVIMVLKIQCGAIM